MVKRKIDQWASEDADFINTAAIREFSLGYPDEFDDILFRIKQWLGHPETEKGLTVIEVILRQLERDAQRILRRDQYAEGNIYRLSAQTVLSSATNLREHLRKNEAEQAAIETIRLISAAICADMHDTIVTGLRIQAGQHRGSHILNKKKGIVLAIEKALNGLKQENRRISRESLWRYFERHHDINEDQEPIKIENYEVFFSDGRLCQTTYLGNKTKMNSIGKDRFFKYVTAIRKKTGSFTK